MPVVAIDPTNTARMFLDYTVGGAPRSVTLRFSNGDNARSKLGNVHSFIDSQSAAFGNNVVFSGARLAGKGSNVTVPLDWVAIDGTAPAAIENPNKTLFASIVGRDDTGHKVRWFWYGLFFGAPPADYRIDGESFPLVTGFFVDFQAFVAANSVLTINLLPPTINDYVNVGYNAYHQRQARKG